MNTNENRKKSFEKIQDIHATTSTFVAPSTKSTSKSSLVARSRYSRIFILFVKIFHLIIDFTCVQFLRSDVIRSESKKKCVYFLFLLQKLVIFKYCL